MASYDITLWCLWYNPMASYTGMPKYLSDLKTDPRSRSGRPWGSRQSISAFERSQLERHLQGRSSPMQDLSTLLPPHTASDCIDLSQLNPNLSQLNPNLSQLNPNLSQLNPNLSQLNPNLSQLNPNIATNFIGTNLWMLRRCCRDRVGCNLRAGWQVNYFWFTYVISMS